MEQNLACVDLELDPGQVERLDRVSAIELGFPHDFLQSDSVRQTVYGEGFERVEDRRSTVARSAADVPEAPRAKAAQ